MGIEIGVSLFIVLPHTYARSTTYRRRVPILQPAATRIEWV